MVVSSEHSYKCLDAKNAEKLLAVWVTTNFSTKTCYHGVSWRSSRQKTNTNISTYLYTHPAAKKTKKTRCV